MKKDSRYNFSSKSLIIASLAIMTLFALFIVGIFYKVYDISRKSIENLYSTTSMQAARDVKHYFTMPMDAVAFSAVTLNNMLKEGVPNEEAGAYLINQTAIYSSIVDENYTGVYAFYNGEYLDGSGWTPPDDYEPKERAWYKAAVAAGGKITLVEPYYNLQTFEVMMSVSQLLDDGESVVSMDIFLDSVQKMAEQVQSNTDLEKALVLDESGLVAAGSDPDEVGKNFKDSLEKYKTDIYNAAFNSDNNMLTLSTPSGIKMLFISPVSDNWRMILIVDKSVAFRSLSKIYWISALVFILTMTILGFMFRYIIKKEREAKKLSILSETDSMTGIKNRGAGEVMVRRMIQTDETGMFCVMDADNFKSINDNFGHDVGDKVIIAIAKCLSTSFRGSDVVYRLGGDEFAVFVAGIKNEESGKIAITRFFENFSKIDVPEIGNRELSISIGVSFYPQDNGDSFEALYKRSDSAVYESKKHKGNYITFS